MKIRRNDLVKIMAGHSLYKGRIAKVVSVCKKTRRVRLEGITIKRKIFSSQNKTKNPENKEEGKLLMFHMSNIMFMSSTHNRPVRIGFYQNNIGNKIRIARGKCIRNGLLG